MPQKTDHLAAHAAKWVQAQFAAGIVRKPTKDPLRHLQRFVTLDQQGFPVDRFCHCPNYGASARESPGPRRKSQNRRVRRSAQAIIWLVGSSGVTTISAKSFARRGGKRTPSHHRVRRPHQDQMAEHWGSTRPCRRCRTEHTAKPRASSFAGPAVAGAAADLPAHFPFPSPAAIKAYLVLTATHQNLGPDPYGYGLLDMSTYGWLREESAVVRLVACPCPRTPVPWVIRGPRRCPEPSVSRVIRRPPRSPHPPDEPVVFSTATGGYKVCGIAPNLGQEVWHLCSTWPRGWCRTAQPRG